MQLSTKEVEERVRKSGYILNYGFIVYPIANIGVHVQFQNGNPLELDLYFQKLYNNYYNTVEVVEFQTCFIVNTVPE